MSQINQEKIAASLNLIIDGKEYLIFLILAA